MMSLNMCPLRILVLMALVIDFAEPGCKMVRFNHRTKNTDEHSVHKYTERVTTSKWIDNNSYFEVIGSKGEKIKVPHWGSDALKDEKGEFFEDVEKPVFVAWNSSCAHCYHLSNPHKPLRYSTVRPTTIGIKLWPKHGRKRAAIKAISWQSRIPSPLYDGHLDVDYYQPTKMRLYAGQGKKCLLRTMDFRNEFGEKLTHEALKEVMTPVFQMEPNDDEARPFNSGFEYRMIKFQPGKEIKEKWNCLLLVIDSGSPDPEGNKFALIRNLRLYYERDCKEKDIIFPPQPKVTFGPEKVAFKKGKVGASFGQSCSNTRATRWMKGREEKHLWVCLKEGSSLCNVAPPLAHLYERDMSKPESVALSLINGAKKEVVASHAGPYTCYEDKYSFFSDVPDRITKYELTVYESLVCGVDVTRFKLDEVIELSCSVVATGNGVPDLEFKILDSANNVVSSLGFDSLDGKTVRKSVRLTKALDGRRLVCAFRGFDGRLAEDRLDDCDVSKGILNLAVDECEALCDLDASGECDRL